MISLYKVKSAQRSSREKSNCYCYLANLKMEQLLINI